MEDSDASSTRKRPRLDSGSRSYRSMSADQVHSVSSDHDPAAFPSTPPATTADILTSEPAHVPASNILSPSKLPINVRDSSTTTLGPSLPSPGEKSSTANPGGEEKEAESSRIALDRSAPGSGSPSPLHSPEIEVAEIEDMDGETTETRWRSLGGVAVLDARGIQNDLLLDFPYLDRPNNLIRTVGTIAATFEKSKLLAPVLRCSLLTVPEDDFSLHGEVLVALARWIETYLSTTESLDTHWFELYLDRQEFWDMFPDILYALVDRR